MSVWSEIETPLEATISEQVSDQAADILGRQDDVDKQVEALQKQVEHLQKENGQLECMIDILWEAPRAKDIKEEGENSKENFTHSPYANVCRSLFEKHNLMFSLLLCVSMMKENDKMLDAVVDVATVNEANGEPGKVSVVQMGHLSLICYGKKWSVRRSTDPRTVYVHDSRDIVQMSNLIGAQEKLKWMDEFGSILADGLIENGNQNWLHQQRKTLQKTKLFLKFQDVVMAMSRICPVVESLGNALLGGRMIPESSLELSGCFEVLEKSIAITASQGGKSKSEVIKIELTQGAIADMMTTVHQPENLPLWMDEFGRVLADQITDNKNQAWLNRQKNFVQETQLSIKYQDVQNPRQWPLIIDLQGQANAVTNEKPSRKNQVIPMTNATMKQEPTHIDDELRNSQGSILDDKKLSNTLSQSKTTASETAKVQAVEQTDGKQLHEPPNEITTKRSGLQRQWTQKDHEENEVWRSQLRSTREAQGCDQFEDGWTSKELMEAFLDIEEIEPPPATSLLKYVVLKEFGMKVGEELESLGFVV
ncbi:hypothetical protein BSKO_05774 [Bryopsis sp. KO-2023]|nr:hypothetical protein BSKO_05774 [Bryopsis sp. KO-2023]